MIYRGYELRLEAGRYKVYTPEGKYIGSAADAKDARRWVNEHRVALASLSNSSPTEDA